MKIPNLASIFQNKKSHNQKIDAETTDERSPRENLLWDLGITARSRFVASKRISEREAGLTRVTAFTSAYLIALTALPKFIPLPEYISSRVDYASVALSVIILASSLLQYASGYAVKSEQHQRSAMEIDYLRGLVEADLEISISDIKIYRNKYNDIIHKYAQNHSTLDFNQVQLDRPNEFWWLSKDDRKTLWWKIFLDDSIPNVALLVVTATVAWLVFGYALPSAL